MRFSLYQNYQNTLVLFNAVCLIASPPAQQRVLLLWQCLCLVSLLSNPLDLQRKCKAQSHFWCHLTVSMFHPSISPPTLTSSELSPVQHIHPTMHLGLEGPPRLKAGGLRRARPADGGVTCTPTSPSPTSSTTGTRARPSCPQLTP